MMTMFFTWGDFSFDEYVCSMTHSFSYQHIYCLCATSQFLGWHRQKKIKFAYFMNFTFAIQEFILIPMLTV
jgi:hypothetical protein